MADFTLFEPESVTHRQVIDVDVHATSYADATRQVLNWASACESRYVCVSNVHVIMEAHDSESFRQVVAGADLVTPDGMPLVWALRAQGIPDATRVYGPTLTLHVCEAAAKAGIPIGLYGGTPDSLNDFIAFLHDRFPGIHIACAISPPFRPLTPEEDCVYTQQIADSGARILFVGIGCPRQEQWMAAHRGRIPAVMLGVGAAFDFHSGRVRQAPPLLQRLGLEWLFRLLMEPRRLWKRYFKHNPRYAYLLARQLLRARLGKGMQIGLFLLVGLLAAVNARAQQDGLLQIGDPTSTFLERQKAAGRLPQAHLSHRPLSAYEAQEYLRVLEADSARLNPTDRALLDRYLGHTAAPGATGMNRRVPFLYRNGQDFFSVEDDGYAVRLNPLADLSYGQVVQSERSARPHVQTTWQNHRGVRASGHIGPHFFFESRLEETQVLLPPAERSRFRERIGFAYNFDGKTYDFWTVTGVAGLRTRHFEVRFGRDRQHWGPGLNALFFSGYAPPHEFIQVRTTLGRLQYTNHFAALQDVRTARDPDDLTQPFKYAAMHRLALALPGRVELGIFESIVLAPTASERWPGFYWAFLNPVIFLRAVDLDVGSPGNVLVGADANWVAMPGLAVSGQFFLDDFESKRIFSDPGYWKNTYGYSLGLHLVDPRIDNLDLFLEYSRLRPYVYSNRTPGLSYTSRYGVLGYSLGPNAYDVTFRATYHPALRWTAELTASVGRRGRNQPGKNYGADPFIPYDKNRVADEGVRVGQGVRQDLFLLEAHTGYELLPDLFLELALRASSTDDADLGMDRYVNPSLALRWGLPFRSARY